MELISRKIGRPVTFPEFVEHIANFYLAGKAIRDDVHPDK
jgi:hypothetical protein